MNYFAMFYLMFRLFPNNVHKNKCMKFTCKKTHIWQNNSIGKIVRLFSPSFYILKKFFIKLNLICLPQKQVTLDCTLNPIQFVNKLTNRKHYPTLDYGQKRQLFQAGNETNVVLQDVGTFYWQISAFKCHFGPICGLNL